jgi:hypothetical protein
MAIVWYPSGFSRSANVVSFNGSPPTDSAENTILRPCDGPGALGAYTALGEPTPERIGRRPVNIAALEGEQTWNPLYHD